MIKINGVPTDDAALYSDYPDGSIEKRILDIMSKSPDSFDFQSEDELRFELRLRRAIVEAAGALGKSGLRFRTFNKTFCNPDFWTRRSDGGFELKRGASPSAAINDIYENGQKYGTECATAMQIIYYKALLEVLPEKTFDNTFRHIYLMNWHKLDPNLSETGLLPETSNFFPGDRRYFKNPDVNPKTPEWQGENVIDMGDGTYYGHGIGREHADSIIKSLNGNRRRGSNTSAYLMQTAGRPDFTKIYNRLLA